jgi:serine/threonine protein phosphatase PrpC
LAEEQSTLYPHRSLFEAGLITFALPIPTLQGRSRDKGASGRSPASSTIQDIEEIASVPFVSRPQERIFPGDTLALYTDGVTESSNDAGEEFGQQRLVEALRRNRELPLKALMASLVNEVRRFSLHEQQDDITLIVAKHNQ